MLQSLVMIMRHVVFQCDKNALAFHCRTNTESTRKLYQQLHSSTQRRQNRQKWEIKLTAASAHNDLLDLLTN